MLCGANTPIVLSGKIDVRVLVVVVVVAVVALEVADVVIDEKVESGGRRVGEIDIDDCWAVLKVTVGS